MFAASGGKRRMSRRYVGTPPPQRRTTEQLISVCRRSFGGRMYQADFGAPHSRSSTKIFGHRVKKRFLIRKAEKP